MAKSYCCIRRKIFHNLAAIEQAVAESRLTIPVEPDGGGDGVAAAAADDAAAPEPDVRDDKKK